MLSWLQIGNSLQSILDWLIRREIGESAITSHTKHQILNDNIGLSAEINTDLPRWNVTKLKLVIYVNVDTALQS